LDDVGQYKFHAEIVDELALDDLINDDDDEEDDEELD